MKAITLPAPDAALVVACGLRPKQLEDALDRLQVGELIVIHVASRDLDDDDELFLKEIRAYLKQPWLAAESKEFDRLLPFHRHIIGVVRRVEAIAWLHGPFYSFQRCASFRRISMEKPIPALSPWDRGPWELPEEYEWLVRLELENKEFKR